METHIVPSDDVTEWQHVFVRTVKEQLGFSGEPVAQIPALPVGPVPDPVRKTSKSPKLKEPPRSQLAQPDFSLTSV